VASEHPFGPNTASILATEHWSLLTARALIWNEAMSRATVFLTVLSASIIALALLADATGFGPQTTTLVLVLLPIVLLLGIATIVATVDAALATAIGVGNAVPPAAHVLHPLRDTTPRFPTPPDAP
jgi:hypothetical protein